jgi:hypothetical protein
MKPTLKQKALKATMTLFRVPTFYSSFILSALTDKGNTKSSPFQSAI